MTDDAARHISREGRAALDDLKATATGVAWPVVSKRVQPTNPGRERELGRVAVWLDPADGEWLAGHCCCTDDTMEAERERCARIRFRMHAALHKAPHSNRG